MRTCLSLSLDYSGEKFIALIESQVLLIFYGDTPIKGGVLLDFPFPITPHFRYSSMGRADIWENTASWCQRRWSDACGGMVMARRCLFVFIFLPILRKRNESVQSPAAVIMFASFLSCAVNSSQNRYYWLLLIYRFSLSRHEIRLSTYDLLLRMLCDGAE